VAHPVGQAFQPDGLPQVIQGVRFKPSRIAFEPWMTNA